MAQVSDIILPSPAYTEQNGLFINLEGRLQKCNKASYPPGNSIEDWKIFNLLTKSLINKENFKNFNQLRENTLNKVRKKFNKKIDSTPNEFFDEFVNIKKIDYYFSNAIARASKTMSDCRSIRTNNFKNGSNN